MNLDLEREVRGLLEERASESRIHVEPQRSVVRRARRRQIGTVGGAAATAVAVVAALGLVVAALGRSPTTPATEQIEPSPVKTVHLPDVTMSYPANWYLLMFETVGGEGDLVQLTNFDPASTKPCFTGEAGDLPSDGVVLLLDRGNGSTGPGADRWPVDLAYDPSPSACRPGGLMESPQPSAPLHYSTTWTSDDGTTPYEVNAMIGPDADGATRTALFDAFASLSVAESDTPYVGSAAYVLDTGGHAEDAWVLYATSHDHGLVGLWFPSRPGGLGGTISDVSQSDFEGELAGMTSRQNSAMWMWGFARPDVSRILAVGDNGARANATTYALPPSLGSVDRAFTIAVPDPSSTTYTTYDSDGHELSGLSVGEATASAPGT
jgi:hypothetical protein